MKRRFSAIRTLVPITLGSLLIVLAFGGLSGADTRGQVSHDWELYVEQVGQRRTLLLEMREHFGYGGAIHDFKNLLIRGDERYSDRVAGDLDGVRTAVTRYAALPNISAAESAALDDILSVVAQYESNLLRLPSLRFELASVTALDEQVRVDDTPALLGFVTLQARLSELSRLLSRDFEAQLERASTVLSTTAVVGVAAVFLVMVFVSWRLERGFRERDDVLSREASSFGFDIQVQAALELADEEPEVFDVIERGLAETLGQASMELLVADNSLARLTPALASRDVEPPGCPVKKPSDCAAVRRGRTMTFSSSETLDTCPRLRNRPSGPCSAVCVPLTLMGGHAGVLHVIGEKEVPMAPLVLKQLESVINHSGSRLSVLRTLAVTRLQADTDPLTGALNRRSFERDCAAAMTRSDGPHTVVMCDLDHFKELNDTAGHEAGDRALELFADVVRTTLRPVDLFGRYGGEEFCMMLNDCDEERATRVLDRLRAALSEATRRYAGPRFTASFGAASFPANGRDVPGLLGTADRCLYLAKESGRDCVRTSSDLATNSPSVIPPRTPSEIPSPSLRHVS